MPASSQPENVKTFKRCLFRSYPFDSPAPIGLFAVGEDDLAESGIFGHDSIPDDHLLGTLDHVALVQGQDVRDPVADDVRLERRISTG